MEESASSLAGSACCSTHIWPRPRRGVVLPRALRMHPGRVSGPARLAGGRRLVRPLRPSHGGGGGPLRRDRHRCRALPDLEPAPRRGDRPGARPARRRGARRAWCGRLRLQRAKRPLPRGEAGAARRARSRRAGRADGAGRTPARHTRRGSRAAAGRHRLTEAGKCADFAVWRTDGLELGGAADPVAGLVLAGPHRVDRLVVGGEEVVRDGTLVRADESEIARAHRRQAKD